MQIAATVWENIRIEREKASELWYKSLNHDQLQKISMVEGRVLIAATADTDADAVSNWLVFLFSINNLIFMFISNRQPSVDRERSAAAAPPPFAAGGRTFNFQVPRRLFMRTTTTETTMHLVRALGGRESACGSIHGWFGSSMCNVFFSCHNGLMRV